jgi:geranylgeranyl reductase family protein
MQEQYDVVVVGAGPIGSYSALYCSKNGLKTLLLDRQRFPRSKPCGGILEAKYFEPLAPFLIGTEENITYHTTLFYDNKKLCVRPLKSYIYKRKKFDSALVNYAVDNGVEFQDCADVTRVSQSQNKVNIDWKDKSSSSVGVRKRTMAKYCIGADGVNSTIRKCAGLDKFRSKNDRIMACLVEEAVPKDEVPWQITTEFDKPAIASYFFSGYSGFAWLAPAKDTINIGMGTPIKNAHNLKKKFGAFMTHAGLQHEIKNSISATIPSSPLREVSSGRIILVGDAAGMVDPWTGGGLNLGFKCARQEADSISSMLASENHDGRNRRNQTFIKSNINEILKWYRMKGAILKILVWCYNHKLTIPPLERSILRYAFPKV